MQEIRHEQDSAATVIESTICGIFGAVWLALLISMLCALVGCGDDIVVGPDALPPKVPHDAAPCDPVVNKICPDAR